MQNTFGNKGLILKTRTSEQLRKNTEQKDRKKKQIKCTGQLIMILSIKMQIDRIIKEVE